MAVSVVNTEIIVGLNRGQRLLELVVRDFGTGLAAMAAAVA